MKHNPYINTRSTTKIITFPILNTSYNDYKDVRNDKTNENRSQRVSNCDDTPIPSKKKGKKKENSGDR